MKIGKKLLAALLALCLTLLPCTALAADSEIVASGEGETYAWKLTADGVLTISGTRMPDFDPPDGKGTDGGPWYEIRDQIKAVVIEDGITNIGDFAFVFCNNLAEVTIPDGVTSIGDSAFWGASFTSISIPDSVTTIKSSAFSHCTKLAGVTLPEGITTIESGIFTNCWSMTTVYIPEDVTSIGNLAFYGCSSLSSINIPNSLTSIGDNAFAFANLTHLTIPSGITELTISGSAFFCCGIQEILFLGSYPNLEGFIPETTTVYYPAGDESWESVDEETRKAIGGTWKPYTSYKVVDGAESSWTVDSTEALRFRAEGALADCVGVMLDGAPVDPANYTLSEGSTIVELHADFLKTLSAGEHTLRILFKDGTADTTFTVKAAETEKPSETEKPVETEKPSETEKPTEPEKPAESDNPKTGDTALLIPAVLMSLCALYLLCLNRKKRVQ